MLDVREVVGLASEGEELLALQRPFEDALVSEAALDGRSRCLLVSAANKS